MPTRTHLTGLLVALCAALTLLGAGCSSSDSSSPGVVSDTGGGDRDADLDADPDAEEDADDDATTQEDGADDPGDDADEDGITPLDGDDDLGGDDDADSSDRLRELGELCDTDADCRSFVCVGLDDSIDEGICSTFCRNDSDCPTAEWDCVTLFPDAIDPQQVCLPVDLCIDPDEDGYGVGPGCRGIDCDQEDPNTHAGADERCDGADNDCDDTVDENPADANRDCSTGFPGVCSVGRTVCDGGLLICEQSVTPRSELCDGLDNDCDGAVDEGATGEALTESCYAGDPATVGVGLCRAGVRRCVGGRFLDCAEQVVPTAELCDGQDNDCDGEVDEGNPEGDVVCETGELGSCSSGRTRCLLGELICEPDASEGEEICDGRDNDCDGEIDEGEDGEPLTRACYDGPEDTEGVGDCEAGLQTCVDADWTGCVGAQLPGSERCDLADNDCDGEADEGDPGGGLACETGDPGVCRVGTTFCDEDGTIGCEPNTPPSFEICDGFDNNCNGEVDEEEAGGPLMRSCYEGPEGTEGVGVCLAGDRTCVAGDFGPCVGMVTPSIELCDGLDNDCDGDVDEGNPEGNRICDTGVPGLCQNGRTICRGGELLCEPDFIPTDEICDGRDNDCDGRVDEGEDGDPLRRECYAGDPDLVGIGVCVAGAEECLGGDWGACVGDVLPGSEECDNLDNDCDGEVDEGNPEGNVFCETGAPGICSVGRTTCLEGELECVPDAATGPEICDGLDNDCDGAIDEGDDGLPLRRACYGGPAGTGDVGACEVGTQTCFDREWGTCVGEVRPGFEVCDGEDNDCDGSTDEGDPGGGVICDTGLAGECSDGRTTCTDGEVVCESILAVAEERCDGRDNDCDGLVDEGRDGRELTRTCYSGDLSKIGVGACVAGRQTCRAADWGTCLGQVLPSSEACDGVDNDCDGSTDEGVGSVYYRDADGDGFGNPSSPLSACSLPGGYVTNDDDCYDGNAQARPGQRDWFSGHRGDGSYDYNCDGAQERRWTTRNDGCAVDFFSCVADGKGWDGGVPGCGVRANWVDDCDVSFSICSRDRDPRTQECR